MFARLSFRQPALRHRIDIGLEIRRAEDGDGVFARVKVVEWNREGVKRCSVCEFCSRELRLTDEDELSSKAAW